MTQTTPTPTPEPVSAERVFSDFLDGIVRAAPELLSGVLFLIIAYVLIRVILRILRSTFERIYPDRERLIVDLSISVVGLFLWFGAALGLLNIIGLGQVAASLGTASGFIGLGIAFALKEMIADTVAGVYLIRDPDFTEGDTVSTASVEGTVVEVDLRKTRLATDDGDLVVLANRDVEKKWVKTDDHAAEGDPT